MFLSESRSWRAAAGAGPALWVASDVPLAEPSVKRQLAYVYHPSKASPATLRPGRKAAAAPAAAMEAVLACRLCSPAPAAVGCLYGRAHWRIM